MGGGARQRRRAGGAGGGAAAGALALAAALALALVAGAQAFRERNNPWAMVEHGRKVLCDDDLKLCSLKKGSCKKNPYCRWTKSAPKGSKCARATDACNAVQGAQRRKRCNAITTALGGASPLTCQCTRRPQGRGVVCGQSLQALPALICSRHSPGRAERPPPQTPGGLRAARSGPGPHLRGRVARARPSRTSAAESHERGRVARARQSGLEFFFSSRF